MSKQTLFFEVKFFPTLLTPTIIKQLSIALEEIKDFGKGDLQSKLIFIPHFYEHVNNDYIRQFKQAFEKELKSGTLIIEPYVSSYEELQRHGLNLQTL